MACVRHARSVGHPALTAFPWLCSTNNFVGAELEIVSPSPAPSTSQGADTDSRRFYIAPDARDHKHSMRIAAHEPKSINKHGPLSFNGEAINVR
jgi:hypothetical protein